MSDDEAAVDGDETADQAADEPSPPKDGGGAPRVAAGAGGIALLATLATAAAVTLAFRPERAGSPLVLGIIGGAYAPMLLATLWWLRRRGQLKQRLLPARGDITIGALIAGGCYMLAALVHLTLSGIEGIEEAWIMRLYLHIGDPRTTVSFTVGIAVLVIAAAEEVVWRGWVMASLVETLGEVRGWLGATALYALAHAATVVLLADPHAGPNPLLVTAAAGLGLLWGYLALRLGRLGPSLFAHALFSWAVVEYPLWRL
jgi:membrane protease YdiL (CAAX protease family)